MLSNYLVKLSMIKQNFILYCLYGIVISVFIGLPAFGFYWFQQNTYSAETLQMAPFDYPVNPSSCINNVKNGTAGHSENLRTEKGFRFRVKTPSNYNRHYGHSLLLVYSPSIMSSMMERFVGLTNMATQLGFIIAYVDGKPLSIKSITELGQVANEIIKQWCINPDRVYFTGHSDGGTVSSALAFLPESPVRPRAIAPSAAGINADEYAKMECPAPTAVMMMHGKNDGHFPGFGQQAAQWWAQCNQCDTSASATEDGKCLRFDNCKSGKETLFCQTEGGHIHWPKLNKEMLDFFQRNK